VKCAGHDRNRAVLEGGHPDVVVAFKDALAHNLRRGSTENMVRIACSAGA